jgi:hypothetical protein
MGDPLVGRLVDLTGRRPLADRALAFLGRALTPGDGRRLQLLARATTADDGSFVTSRPQGRYAEAFVILDDGTGRLHLELELDGTFPDEVVIFLNELESHLRYAH